MKKFIRQIGNISFYGKYGMPNEMRKKSKIGSGEEFARFNPYSADSIKNAAEYVGATKREISMILDEMF